MDLEEQLQVLRQQYVGQLPKKFAEIAEHWRQLRAQDDATLRATLHRLTHSLAGSGATYGFPDISTAARRAENLFKIQPDAPDHPLPQEELESALNDLGKVIEGVTVPIPASNSVAAVPQQLSVPERQIRILHFVSPHQEQSATFAARVHAYGYEARVFTSLSASLEGFDSQPGGALLLDMDTPDFKSGALDERLKRTHQHRDFPLMMVSSRDDVVTRLAAVRAGADGFFVYPIDLSRLVDKLDAGAVRVIEPFRILIVDDSPEVAAYNAQVLSAAGMLTRIVTDPLLAVDALRAFDPDLALLDLYMPDCNGIELAKVIRLHDAYVAMPIVYLSGEREIGAQLSAMSHGDDFLVKPIDPEHLVRSITERVQRFRKLRSHMLRDSLTGLLNHTTITERLHEELMRLSRIPSGKLVVGIVDIDHFKGVNDSYGHPVGDLVIKNLSRLLKQRLRRADIVGRVGGEEFMVILLDTGMDNALRIMEDMRVAFAEFVHTAQDVNLSVTFSCGLAEATAKKDAAELTDAADQALYQAKHSGRNRVVAYLDK